MSPSASAFACSIATATNLVACCHRDRKLPGDDCASLDDGDVLGIGEHTDVGRRIAVDHEDVGEVALAHGTELVAATHRRRRR